MSAPGLAKAPSSLEPSPAPEVIGWETTLRCNMRCQHCGSTAGDARPRELDTAEALELCRQMIELGVERVCLTGGETLLRSDWPEITEALLAGGRHVGLLTNGWLLTGATLTQLTCYSGAKLYVSISLDGAPEDHDIIRGIPGSFARAWEGGLRLNDAAVPVAIITTVNRKNLAGLARLRERLFAELQPYAWQIQVTTPFGRAREGGLFLSPAQYVQLACFVAESKRMAEGRSTRIYAGDCLGYHSSIDAGFREPWGGCGAGLQLLGIQSNGNIKGCLSIIDDGYIEGNALRDGLAAIWRKKGAFSYTRSFEAAALKGWCKECEVGARCRGGCTASAVAANGAAHHAPYCIRVFEQAATANRSRSRASAH